MDDVTSEETARDGRLGEESNQENRYNSEYITGRKRPKPGPQWFVTPGPFRREPSS